MGKLFLCLYYIALSFFRPKSHLCRHWIFLPLRLSIKLPSSCAIRSNVKIPLTDFALLFRWYFFLWLRKRIKMRDINEGDKEGKGRLTEKLCEWDWERKKEQRESIVVARRRSSRNRRGQKRQGWPGVFLTWLI